MASAERSIASSSNLKDFGNTSDLSHSRPVYFQTDRVRHKTNTEPVPMQKLKQKGGRKLGFSWTGNKNTSGGSTSIAAKKTPNDIRPTKAPAQSTSPAATQPILQRLTSVLHPNWWTRHKRIAPVPPSKTPICLSNSGTSGSSWSNNGIHARSYLRRPSHLNHNYITVNSTPPPESLNTPNARSNAAARRPLSLLHLGRRPVELSMPSESSEALVGGVEFVHRPRGGKSTGETMKPWKSHAGCL